jgi:hypothetical protein
VSWREAEAAGVWCWRSLRTRLADMMPDYFYFIFYLAIASLASFMLTTIAFFISFLFCLPTLVFVT